MQGAVFRSLAIKRHKTITNTIKSVVTLVYFITSTV